MKVGGAWMRRGVMLAVLVLGAFPGVSQAALTWSLPVFVNDHQMAPMLAVVCPSTFQCTAIDRRGMEVTFDPGSAEHWSAYAIDASQALECVACPSISRCTSVDDAGREVTFDPQAGGSATAYTIDRGYSLRAVACPTVSQCTAIDTGRRPAGSSSANRGP